ncbi:DCC1-like thiol-disulfide oxidoreductase family protein [Bacillus sp. AFS088145]|uniref:thiol-disulfide oxidoreductase DCC family protein n=1 Tax=Bacillus sp. AFS088145 TaxID=2033514 RepID=UPI000BF6C431|nr:DCC1-like thiol-disulfide oxidoreductase family protein [Bacillus sp. AFS088145]PFH83003.1 thiol-disulfide oxidoreductase [Bacillus sp. AFS088145]
MSERPIILFDGECILCNGAVQFIIKHDQKGYFHFAALQSTFGQKLKKDHPELSSIDSIILVQNGKIKIESSAALSIAKNLEGWPKFFYAFIIIPTTIRDYLYRLISRNRFKIFGKNETCMIPSKEIRDRFYL